MWWQKLFLPERVITDRKYVIQRETVDGKISIAATVFFINHFSFYY